ncbi:flavin oxidoreductase [Flavobacterium sp. SOK18b]|uniref:flavin reductase family protein n=1 Tax=unclassified Flavobacterium TaxID=196869 RepID=UPI0015F91FE6|nr:MULTISPECIES: flavin reductase family protein [unclassified Flavobacterium]MBB1194500.1 flavin oxidoreductase [Flavobacterium sp. SOK18b]QZK89450.1 flavin reductase family protein [Flavobacterium sp. CHNK8]
MKHISRDIISQMEKIERLNLINSCTGYKSANLLGTKSIDGKSNVAIFSSVTHLGSNPAMIGFIMRPTTVPRDTYKNIKDTGYFTVNHITADMIEAAHHTSANYELGVSEFDKTTLEEEFKEGIPTPFVKGSPVQLLCKYVNEYHIVENDTIHVIASIEHIFYKEELEHKDGWLQIDRGNVVAINGLDGYCLPKLLDRFQYARKEIPTTSFFKK